MGNLLGKRKKSPLPTSNQGLIKCGRNMAPRILDAAVPICADVLNPFTHSVQLSTFDKIRIGVMTVLVFPLRVVLMKMSLVLAWVLARVGLWGLDPGQIRTLPITGWRRVLKVLELLACRMGFWAIGFLHIKVKGIKEPRAKTPIVVAAPHSSFFDTLLEFTVGLHCPVVREQNRGTPVLSTLIDITQPLYVEREDPESRQQTIQEIKRRSHSSDPWEQLLIFPEGTCTNHTCLIPFKLGAFHPGLPIQPVIITYPNTLDSLTWTWHGPSAVKQLWYTMTQLYINCEIEFLPVYEPNEEEKKDPRLFAENVRKVVANKLRLPLSYFSYDDIQHICHASKHGLPQSAALIKLLKLQSKKGLEVMNVVREIETISLRLEHHQGTTHMSRQDLTSFLHMKPYEALRDFFETMDQDKKGVIDARTFLAGLWLTHLGLPMARRVEQAFCALSATVPSQAVVNEEGFQAICWLLLGLPSDLASDIFYQLNGDLPHVSFSTFRKCLRETERFKDLLEEKPHKNGFIASTKSD